MGDSLSELYVKVRMHDNEAVNRLRKTNDLLTAFLVSLGISNETLTKMVLDNREFVLAYDKAIKEGEYGK